MKMIKLLLATIIAFATIQTANAQSGKENIQNTTKTQNVKVYGECSMCKKRIEKAASTVDGVQSAIWDENSKILIIKYNPFKKEAVDNVQKKVASVGHDTEKYTATDAAYNSLPGCCHYERKSGQ